MKRIADSGENEYTNRYTLTAEMSLNLPTTAYTAAEAAALDCYTVEELGVDLRQLMEVAGMRSAEIALQLFGEGTHVTLLAGPGGNGGDALVCAKWLKLWGCTPVVLLSHALNRLRPVTAHQLSVWKAFGGEVSTQPPEHTDGIVDGLLGYSLSGDPRGYAAELINWANTTEKPILALDIPSGMDATMGYVRTPCIQAHATAVFGVLKQGLLQQNTSSYTGEIHLVDIGFPREFPHHVIPDGARDDTRATTR